MSIQSLASSSSVLAGSQAARPQRPHDGGGFEKALSGVAEKLGMSTDDLQSALKSGSTLDDLASQKGVSQSDLISTLKDGLQANKPAGAPELDDTQLTQMATDIAAGKGPQGPHGAGGHHHHGGPKPGDSGSDTDSNLSNLADALGIDSSTLTTAIQNGASLASLLNAGSSSSTGYGSSYSSASAGGLAVDTYA